ncbi:MAG: hypothetical protein SGI74_01235 [Oligoflexia bacterium]|nr:hypothetical protein [Oligoflexia bacterium]
MKKLFLIILVSIFSIESFAQQVWVTSSQLSSRDQLIKLADIRRPEFQDIDLISWHEAQLAHPITREELTTLLQQEEKAKDLSLKGDFKGSLGLYLKLLGQLETLPNVAGIEKITFATLVRIAEISTVLKKQDAGSWWKQARGFVKNLNFKDQQFSPQVIEKLKSVKFKMNKIILTINTNPNDILYIDGRRIFCSQANCEVSVLPGIHLIAAISPGSQWVVQKINISESDKIPKISFLFEPVVTGDCDHPRYVGKQLPSKIKLLARFQGTVCERVYDGKKWYSTQKKPLEMYLPVTTSQFENFEAPTQKSWFQKMVRSPWFWIGAGLVTAGTVIAVKKSQESETVIVPTHTNK